jgi:hypothetical protein
MAIIDTRDIPEEEEFAPYPDNSKKVLICTKAAYEPTKNGKGMMFSLVWQVEGTNRNIFDYIIVEHPSDQARNIGRSKIKKLATSINTPVIETAETFVGKRVLGKLGVDEWEGKKNNKIKAYEPVPRGEFEQSAPPRQESNGDNAPSGTSSTDGHADISLDDIPF